MMIPAKFAAEFMNGYAFKPSDWGDNGLPILRIAQLSGGDFDNYYSGDIPQRYHINNGDLLFAWSATIDSFLWDRGDALLNQHIFKVIPYKGVDLKFLYYSLKHYAPFWADIDAHGSTTRHIKKESLGRKIFIPTESEQEKISSFLDNEVSKINTLIDKKKEFLSLVEEKRKILSDQLLTGEILYPCRTGVSGWFGNLPENWQARRAKYLFSEAKGRSDTGEEELLTVSHITGVTKRSEKNVNMFMAETNEGYKLVKRSDLVINTMWAWMGAMGVSPCDGLISPSYGVYHPIRKIYEADYLDLIVRSKLFIAEATRRSKGIHSSRLRLYPDAFLDIRLPIPSREEQKSAVKKYKEITAKEENLVQLNLKSLNLLEEFKSSLIAEAVTGQLDIHAWQRRGAGDRQLDQIERETEQEYKSKKARA